MNFTKSEGKGINDLNFIISEDLQNKFKTELRYKNKISRELEEDLINNTAYITYKDTNYPNVTYSFGCYSLKELIEGFELLKDNFIKELPSKSFHVSFRLPITITQEDDRYILMFRAAVISL